MIIFSGPGLQQRTRSLRIIMGTDENLANDTFRIKMAHSQKRCAVPLVKDVLLWGKSDMTPKSGSGERENFLITVTFFGSLPYNAPPRPRRNHWLGTRNFFRRHVYRYPSGSVGGGPLQHHKSDTCFSPDFPRRRANGFYGGAREHCMVNFQRKVR